MAATKVEASIRADTAGKPGALGSFAVTVRVADANQRTTREATPIEVASRDEICATSVSAASLGGR